MQVDQSRRKAKLDVPCCYQGGKQRVAKEVVDAFFSGSKEIDEKTHFYDLCCGSGAITVELVNRGVSPERITMLDISSWGTFWKTVGEGSFDLRTFKRYLDAIPSDKRLVHDHMTAFSQGNAAIDEPYKYILLQACSFGGKQIWRDGSRWKNAFFRSYWEPTAHSIRRSPANPMQPCPETLYKRINKIVDSCIGIECIHADISSIFTLAIPDNSVIYVDPPYRDKTGYAFGFDLHAFVSLLQAYTNAPIYVSEGGPISKKSQQLIFGGAKGGISGSKARKHEEWLSLVG